MEAKVTIYWGTGIDPQNIPYNINEYLAGRDRLSVAAVWTLQTKDLAKIRLDAVEIKSAGQDIMNADYLTVEKDCYFIGAIMMLSEMTAEITLIPDYIDSLGGLSVLAGKVSGWVSRSHVALADDKLFSNVIEEPFTPSAPLEITGYEKLTGDDTTWGTTVVAANVDLTKIVKNEALEYKTASGETAIIPQLQPVPSAGTAEENKVAECLSYMTLPVAGNKKRVIPATACFPFRSTGIQKGIQTARSLGMEDTITAEYGIIPPHMEGMFGHYRQRTCPRESSLRIWRVLVKPALRFPFIRIIPPHMEGMFSTCSLLIVPKNHPSAYGGYT